MSANQCYGVDLKVATPCHGCGSSIALRLFLAVAPTRGYWVECLACGHRGPESQAWDVPIDQAIAWALERWDGCHVVGAVRVVAPRGGA